VRVGVIGRISQDYFADNVIDALQHMGHNVTHLGCARPDHRYKIVGWISTTMRQGMPRLDEQLQQGIARAAIEARCEVVISLEALLVPGVVRQLRRYGIRTAFWFPDAVSNIGRQMMLLAPYDALFFKEPHVVERLQASLDLQIYYLPEACNPRWHRPLTEAGTEPYLVIAGNMYPSRVKLLERLVATGIPLRLYGSGFPRWIGDSSAREMHTGRAVIREEKAQVFRSAAGVLNTLHPAEISGVNARLFEATGCGAAVLTEYRPVVPELFTIEDEVLVFHNFDELVDQAKRLLNDVGLSAALGDAATRRAHRDHSYERRLSFILEKLS
jgi:spore maturation protein CgeB